MVGQRTKERESKLESRTYVRVLSTQRLAIDSENLPNKLASEEFYIGIKIDHILEGSNMRRMARDTGRTSWNDEFKAIP